MSRNIRTRCLLTSTSFIMGTGLKKWRPANRSCLVVALAMFVICKEDVLLAKMVCLWREETVESQNESHVSPRSAPQRCIIPVHEADLPPLPTPPHIPLRKSVRRCVYRKG